MKNQKIIYSKSFIDFLVNSDSVIAALLLKVHSKNRPSLLITSENINYITFRGNGNISYLPDGKEHVFNDDTNEWKRDNRQEGKPAKVIRKLMSARALKMFKDSDFESFANQYKARFNDDGYIFKLKGREEIKNVYCQSRKEGDGSLNNSCMNGDSDYLDLYENCVSLRILTLENKDGLLCGRALVWNVEDITLMDRVYVTDDFMYDKFLDYCDKANWWRKKDYKTYSNKTYFLDSNGELYSKQFTIQTDTDWDYYPYIDTFSYGGDGYITNCCGEIYEYNQTGGTRSGDEDEDDHEGEVWSDLHDCYIHEDEACYITAGERRYVDRYAYSNEVVYIGDDCYHENDENIVYVGGEYYTTDSSDLCEIDGDYYLMDDCVYCERDSCYYKSEDCVYCEIDGEDVLRDEAVEIDGNWYHQDSDLIFEHKGKYYLEDSGVEK